MRTMRILVAIVVAICLSSFPLLAEDDNEPKHPPHASHQKHGKKKHEKKAGEHKGGEGPEHTGAKPGPGAKKEPDVHPKPKPAKVDSGAKKITAGPDDGPRPTPVKAKELARPKPTGKVQENTEATPTPIGLKKTLDPKSPGDSAPARSSQGVTGTSVVSGSPQPKQDPTKTDGSERNVPPWGKGSIPEREKDIADRLRGGTRDGSLTKDEAEQLNAQYQKILDRERKYRSDGTLTPEERADLRQQLGDVRRLIFVERHDTDGRQLAYGPLGRNVFLKDTVIKRLEDPNFGRAEGQAFLRDSRTALDLHRRLRQGNLTPEERNRLTKEYDEILLRYFDVR